MLTKTNLKTIIVNNLNDIRITAIALFINRLISRNKYDGNIPQYRIKNIINNTYVTNLTDFSSNIDANSLIMDYYFNSDKITSDRIHPFTVILGNYIVELNPNSEEDSFYTSIYGNSSKIILLMNYLADGDITLPLKIFEIKLI